MNTVLDKQTILESAWKLAERIANEAEQEPPPIELIYADVRFASALGWVTGNEWWTEEHHMWWMEGVW